MKTSRSRRLVARHEGFTLMEIVLVLAIIALLLGMGVYKLVGTYDRAKVQKVEADIQNFDTSLIQYQSSNTLLPTTDQGLEALAKRPTTGPAPRRWSQILKPEALLDPWASPYQYRNPGKHNAQSYDIFSMGPDKQEGTSDDIGNWQ